MSLPSGFKKLEYIQSSGTQYIDTGFKPNQDTRVVCEVGGYSIADNSATNLFGARTSTSSSDQFSFNIAGSTNYRSDYYNSRVGYSTELSFSGKIHIDKNKNVCSIESDGTTYTVTNTQGTFQTPFNLFIFGENRNGSVHTIPNVKLYYFKLYDNGVLIRDFIPCKNASGVVGLWDDANSKFYTNAGTGVFTAGPEVKGTNKTLIDGTAYGVKTGKCLISGTTYGLKKGRTLIGGTGYDIELPSDADGLTWYLNETVDLTSDMQFFVNFYSNAERYTGIMIMDFMGRALMYRIASSSSWTMRFGIGRWEAEGYRTLVFDEVPTGTLLEWLQANGTAI